MCWICWFELRDVFFIYDEVFDVLVDCDCDWWFEFELLWNCDVEGGVYDEFVEYCGYRFVKDYDCVCIYYYSDYLFEFFDLGGWFFCSKS